MPYNDDEYYEYKSINLAREILDMHEELIYLREENIRLHEYKEKYRKLLNTTRDDSLAMHNNMMKMFLTKGVTEAFIKGTEEGEKDE